jgi:glutamate synthase domain-containing protein 2
MRPGRRNEGSSWGQGLYHRVPDILEHWSRRSFAVVTVAGGLLIAAAGLAWWPAWLLGLPWLALALRGILDMRQRNHAILSNFPVLGHLRYVLESLRPELRQYFVEADDEENPISREDRSVVYQRAKGALDTMPFGTRHEIYDPRYEWIAHSLAPKVVPEASSRVLIGGPDCTAPYSASLLNVSAMSYGSLSARAIGALNGGAKLGGFAHNTGEGGLSPYHVEPGGDLVWQVGTGYFGCRTPDGDFDPDLFQDRARLAQVKMIELKLSQGAKPGHGGILPAAKITPEIARIRGVSMGSDVVSPPTHRAFDGPLGLCEFLVRLRELSGGKPVGFKLCVGNPVDFMGLVHAMLETGVTPGFISVDGGEGGTGAAPVEFSDSVGMPLDDGLTFVDDVLTGAGLRDRIRLISAGRIMTGFHLVRQLALGADLCNSARAMMFALGCIQALKCNTNHCPTGVATQLPHLVAGLDVAHKARRVYQFHHATVEAALELIGVAGLEDPTWLRRYHVLRRVDAWQARDLEELYPRITPVSAEDDGSAPVIPHAPVPLRALGLAQPNRRARGRLIERARRVAGRETAP